MSVARQPEGLLANHRLVKLQFSYAPVAQLDRVSPSEGEGHRFDSCQARHFLMVRTGHIGNSLGIKGSTAQEYHFDLFDNLFLA